MLTISSSFAPFSRHYFLCKLNEIGINSRNYAQHGDEVNTKNVAPYWWNRECNHYGNRESTAWDLAVHGSEFSKHFRNYHVCFVFGFKA